MRISIAPVLLSVVLLLFASSKALADTTFIKFGSSWQYLDDGSNQDNGNWKKGNITWPSGPAQLGYGESNERTVISYGGNASNKYITTYFRTSVTIGNPSSFSSFNINMYLDDGAIVYVNGVQVIKTNLPDTITYTTAATAAAAEDGHAIQSFSVPSSSFRSGKNTIAVEVHQNTISSSDLVFDLELVGAGKSAEQIISRGPLLQMLNQTSVTIKWNTAGNATSRVKYGTSENSLTSVIADNKQTTKHELSITGLKPDTRYYYAIGSTTSIIKGSYRNSFTTAPPATTKRKIRIAVFGDAGTGNNVQKAVRDGYMHLSKGSRPDLALLLGDNAYSGGTDAQYQANCFNIYDNNVFDNHPVFPVPGNHEYDNDPAGVAGLRGTHAISYYDNFILPTKAECGGTVSGTEHYYSFDYGNIHFIMLDSYGYDDNKLLYDSTGKQALWLKADLAATAGLHKWTIVCLHHPPYTHGTHNSDTEKDLIAIRQQITPILERFGVDVVLAGHSHVYERTFLVKDHTGLSTPFNTSTEGAGTRIDGSSAKYDGTAKSCPYFTIDSVYKHGTVYVTAGSAGQVGGGTNSQFPVFYYKNYSGDPGGESGALYLEVEDNRLDAKFVGGSGKVRDRFTIMKGVNKNTIINTTVNKPTTLTASWVGNYNWYTTDGNQDTARTLLLKPSSAGNFTYYVNDSINNNKTCIADTFLVQVTSSLAVAVVNYNALVKNNKVIVNWTTMQELNSDYFTIERSANGTDYNMVMVIPGKGNAVAATNYEFIDNNALEGANYYRLTATDKNGDIKIAGIKLVNNNSSKSVSLNIGTK